MSSDSYKAVIIVFNTQHPASTKTKWPAHPQQRAMASFHLSLLLLLLFLCPFSCKANLHKINSLLKSSLISEARISSQSHLNDALPTVFFEVTKPIKLPKTKPCKHFLLQHEFGYTYQKPPVLVDYNPPSHCPSQHFSKIVLEWVATCKGRQFDRIFGIWLGGVDLFILVSSNKSISSSSST